MPDENQAQPMVPTSIVSGLSGNELYCASLLGLTPGNIAVGNSVFSMGIFGGVKANIKTTIGGEIKSFTDMISQGRQLAFNRLTSELQKGHNNGCTGISNQVIFHGNNLEFLSVGSAVNSSSEGQDIFTTSSNAQELFCQVDAGYQPVSFVFGNVAYSIGIAGHMLGSLRQLGRGEVKQYSDIFNQTRNLALDRIIKDAQAVSANAIVGIETTIVPFGDTTVQEMIMVGTAARNELIRNFTTPESVTTSDLTAEETWSITKLGYVPVRLVLATSVYSLGLAGGIKSAFQEMIHGEINPLTEMIYGAREQVMSKLQQQATASGADEVLGVKTYLYNLGGDLVEFMAIGTAVKKVQGAVTRSDQLPPQAVIRDRDTYTNAAAGHGDVNLNGTEQTGSEGRM
jgi:uncharacterized protein YbjQ (UPF0145 family)